MFGGMGFPGAYATAGAGVGGNWFGIGAVVVGVLILIAICCVFCTMI